MSEIKMPTTFRERDMKSRARYPKYNHHDAGWIGDIRRSVIVNDGYENAKTKYENYLTHYKSFEMKALQDEAAEKQKLEREKEKELEKRKSDIELATILVRYNLPIDSSWDDVLDALRSKDKKINLAFAMRNVRGDWNDGCGEVEGALFDPTNTIEREIISDVQARIDNFNDNCRDGRVFRDTEWNYDAILATVEDKQLLKDAETAHDKWYEKRYG
jgi:hypothetical protein